MNQQMNVQVYGGSIARMEGQVFASLYVGQHVVDESEQNAKGIEIMKVSCDEKVYEDMDSTKYPFDAVISVRLKKAGGGKMGQHCVGIQASRPAREAPAKS